MSLAPPRTHDMTNTTNVRLRNFTQGDTHVPFRLLSSSGARSSMHNYNSFNLKAACRTIRAYESQSCLWRINSKDYHEGWIYLKANRPRNNTISLLLFFFSKQGEYTKMEIKCPGLYGAQQTFYRALSLLCCKGIKGRISLGLFPSCIQRYNFFY
jgi:hypothetical protein